MSARGVKRRGRPPKSTVMERPKKFQYNLLKKPKYLQKKQGDEANSTRMTTSRTNSPMELDNRRTTRSRKNKNTKDKHTKKEGYASSYNRRGYDNKAVYLDSEYHYGSDFGDESSDKSDFDDTFQSDAESSEQMELDRSSDSDFSISSFSTTSGTPKKSVTNSQRAPSPEPLWLQNQDLPLLQLPKSSDDLLISAKLLMPCLSIYEVLRRFHSLLRLSPFKFEDFCACMVHEEQSNLLVEIHVSLLKALLREEDAQQTHFGPLDQKDSINISIFLVDGITWPEVLRSYVESDKTFDERVLYILSSTDYPFSDIEDRITVLTFLTGQFLIASAVRENLMHEGMYQKRSFHVYLYDIPRHYKTF